MARVLLFNPTAPDGAGFTREGRCTQRADFWGTVWPPLSLATAAALLEQDGHVVRVVDFSVRANRRQSLSAIIKTMRPDFAIWPTSTETMAYDLRLAQIIKEAGAETITGVFGTDVTVNPDQALQNIFIDAVIRGEPEGVIRDLCLRTRDDWSAIAGLSYRDKKTCRIHHNADHVFLAPEAIPPPAWHLLNLQGYRLPLKGRKFLIVAPVRGCPYRCNFCTAAVYYGAKPRLRPVEKVVEEIADGVSRYGIRDFFIWADTFTLNKQYVQDFCRTIINRRLSICWTCNSRVDTLDEETIDLMREAGLWLISFGMESGNRQILAATGKAITVEQSRAAVELAGEKGIKTAGHFMFGLPGETGATMEETLQLALSLPLTIAQFYAATPYPGTGLYQEAGEKGWLKPGQAMSQKKAVMEIPGLTATEVNSFCRHAYRKFYLRPRIVCSILSMIDVKAILHKE